jgi:hypothetical protein
LLAVQNAIRSSEKTCIGPNNLAQSSPWSSGRDGELDAAESLKH